MTEIIDIYCDESCHLENDKQEVMLLGCIWTPHSQAHRLNVELRSIKKRHDACGELKWTHVSKSRLKFYLEIIDWFFSQSNLNFRCLVVPNKQTLDHEAFNKGSHDTFYYKMYFSLLSKILSPTSKYSIYLDIKDTRSNLKIQKLRDIICCDKYDFTGQMVSKIQHVRSHELELLQIADFLIGAIAYKNRGLITSKTKLTIIDRIERYHEKSLSTSTPLSEIKLNIFIWQPRAGSD